MEHKKMSSIVFSMLLALSLMTSLGFALSNTYYAKTVVYFNVPSDATFSIAMPSDYASGTDITGESEGGATATDWVSFNYSSGDEATLQEPYQLGSAGNTQVGTAQPIFLIDNTGNTASQFEIYVDSAMPSGVELYVNATCGSCTSPLETLTVMGVAEGSANVLTTSLATTGDYLNVSMYSNTTGASDGVSSRTVYVKSTAV